MNPLNKERRVDEELCVKTFAWVWGIMCVRIDVKTRKYVHILRKVMVNLKRRTCWARRQAKFAPDDQKYSDDCVVFSPLPVV